MASLIGKYVVVSPKDSKTFDWMRVTSEDENSVWGKSEKHLPYLSDTVTYSQKDVVAILAKRPREGSVYGQRIEPFYGSEELDHWGTLHYFIRISDEEKTVLRAAFAKIYSKVKHYGLKGLLDLDIEFRPAKGKNYGMFTMKKDYERPRIILRPQENPSFLPHAIAHEIAHGAYVLLSKKGKASWVRKFHSFTKLQEANVEDLKRLRNEFTKQEEGIRDFRSSLDEEDTELFNLCCSWITDHHGLSNEYIDTLITAGDGTTVKSMWPSSKVIKTDYEVPVTEYATKSPTELFCESFALKLLGQKLPKTIDGLMEKSLQKLAGCSR